MNDPNQVAEFGTYYHLKVQMEGYVFSDELMVDEYEDTSKFFESGLVGFINYNADCYYDNLTISGDKFTSNIAVAPLEKLAAKWGHIKTQ